MHIQVRQWIRASALLLAVSCAAAAQDTAQQDSSAESQPAQAPAPMQAPAPGSADGAREENGGFVAARNQYGEVDVSVWAYIRYLNQRALDQKYTDAFGRTSTLDLRQDLQINKVTLYLKGWIYNRKLHYTFYTWTANTSMGLAAQVVVGGFLDYTVHPRLALGAGIGALPTTRSTQGTFPFWLKVDNRTIADEYFRGSYTTGIWADGILTKGLKYKVMLGNNLSQLGVDAGQLDNQFNTVSSAIWWMPTTHEFGPREAYGDFESHEHVATLLGTHYTRSREDKQSQPNANAPENTQIRLSDGTGVFDINAFAPGTQVNRATYKMTAFDAGLKYHGFSLEGSYYARWVGHLSTTGIVPVQNLFDDGYEAYGSTMLRPKSLQAYVAGSKILGQYGHPWDLSGGLNWFPAKNRYLRFNGQLLYLRKSPVGYLSVPFPLGGNGFVFSLDTELVF